MSVISGHAETEKFCNNQRGGAKFLFGRTVFVFLQPPPAACTIPGYEINLRQLQLLGNKHKNHSRHTLHDTLTTRWRQLQRYGNQALAVYIFSIIYFNLKLVTCLVSSNTIDMHSETKM